MKRNCNENGIFRILVCQPLVVVRNKQLLALLVMYGLCEQWNQTHAYRRFLHCKYYKDNFDPKKIINQLEEELASMHTN